MKAREKTRSLRCLSKGIVVAFTCAAGRNGRTHSEREGAVWTVEDNSPRRTKCRDRPRLGGGGRGDACVCKDGARPLSACTLPRKTVVRQMRRGEGGIYPSRAGKSNASTE